MWAPYFLLLLPAVLAEIPYHPKVLKEQKLSIPLLTKQNWKIEAKPLFMEYLLHNQTEMCMKSLMNATIVVMIWTPAEEDASDDLFTLPPSGTYMINRKLGHNWPHIVDNGMNFTFRAQNATAVGSVVLYRCVKETYISLGDDSKSSAVKPLDPWDGLIHIPFSITQENSFKSYTDFSSVIPRLMYYFNIDEQRSSFCFNATVNGPVDVFVKKCLNDEPVKFSIEKSDKRQLVRGWNAGLKLRENCPIGEETLADHVHMEFVSRGHEGVGEILAYNCFHLWRTGDDGNEFLVANPLMDLPESDAWKFQYTVLPFRHNTYFLPIKHMVDSALVFGGKLRMSFGGQYPEMITFSACYNSQRHLTRRGNTSNVFLSRLEARLLSELSFMLDCEEEKSYGIYMHVTTGEKSAKGYVYMKFDIDRPIYTPSEPRLRNDHTAVPFNLRKGQEISRNVNYQNLVQQAFTNNHLDLYLYTNATGRVNVSISRCAHSPRLNLSQPIGKNSFKLTRDEIEHLHGLDSETGCLTDLTPSRYEKYPRPSNKGLYVHVIALENTMGYVVPYEKREAKLKWNQVDRNFQSSRMGGEYFLSQEFVTTKKSTSVVQMKLQLAMERAQEMPPVSLRFFVNCSNPCQIGFARCSDHDVTLWKRVDPLNDKEYAWYSFDEEGVDYLKGLLESTNCKDKAGPMLYVHVKAEKSTSVRMEFGVYKGKDVLVPDEVYQPGGSSLAVLFVGIFVTLGVVIIIFGYVCVLCNGARAPPVVNDDRQDILLQDRNPIVDSP